MSSKCRLGRWRHQIQWSSLYPMIFVENDAIEMARRCRLQHFHRLQAKWCVHGTAFNVYKYIGAPPPHIEFTERTITVNRVDTNNTTNATFHLKHCNHRIRLKNSYSHFLIRRSSDSIRVNFNEYIYFLSQSDNDRHFQMEFKTQNAR